MFSPDLSIHAKPLGFIDMAMHCVSAHTLTDFSMAAIKPRVDSWLPGCVPVRASTSLSIQALQSVTC